MFIPQFTRAKLPGFTKTARLRAGTRACFKRSGNHRSRTPSLRRLRRLICGRKRVKKKKHGAPVPSIEREMALLRQPGREISTWDEIAKSRELSLELQLDRARLPVRCLAIINTSPCQGQLRSAAIFSCSAVRAGFPVFGSNTPRDRQRHDVRASCSLEQDSRKSTLCGLLVVAALRHGATAATSAPPNLSSLRRFRLVVTR